MTLSSWQNPYSFDAFLEKREAFDFYRDDFFLQKAVRKYAGAEWESLHEKLLAFSPKVSFRWRKMTERIARPDVHPTILHYDAFNHRIDRIVRPHESLVLEKEIFSEGLFSDRVTSWESFTKRLLIHELGEFGVTCPIACTDGLIALIEHFHGHGIAELDSILLHCKNGINGDFGIGAQFMSEIQGGSDIPANLVAAVPDGRFYRLYGTKFFCSAIHADYSVVTAKVSGSEHVGTFIVPSWLPGDKDRERRNGYAINRIKWKMGTCELPTAEIHYDGAVAYPIGPLDRGVATAVGIVLTLSRLSIGSASSAFMLRAAREAQMYSEFRDVFGRKIEQYPLVARQLRYLKHAAERTTAGAFKIYDLFLRLGKRNQPGLASDEPLEIRKRRFDFRELVLLQKICTAQETVDVVRKAISILGGHGVMEDFSALPRLLRDAMVNELWEGPKNVLLTQIFRDLQKAASWYAPQEFVANNLAGAPADKIKQLSEALTKLMKRPVLGHPDDQSIQAAEDWETFCADFFRTYQEVALAEIQ
ncbi:acyl-CoA dehydrogenase family protein [Effusibacillus pohliae]|uniref:acyl-CoA dehydrogenase family protein n=1 Tax=Effusibacillus pohliae TaxID=232270 RepID=UPI00037D1514|nr:acyl-CoA dehydrogenase family protein [Effusibacillus pohliae]